MILLMVIIYAIINCGISYEYEIANRDGDEVDIVWVGKWLKETVKVWKLFLCYVLINIVYLSVSFIKNYRC